MKSELRAMTPWKISEFAPRIAMLPVPASRIDLWISTPSFAAPAIVVPNGPAAVAEPPIVMLPPLLLRLLFDKKISSPTRSMKPPLLLMLELAIETELPSPRPDSLMELVALIAAPTSIKMPVAAEESPVMVTFEPLIALLSTTHTPAKARRLVLLLFTPEMVTSAVPASKVATVM